MDEICKNADLDIYPTEHMQFFDCYQSIVVYNAEFKKYKIITSHFQVYFFLY